MAKVAILVGEGAREEEIEFLRRTLEDAEHDVDLLGPDADFDTLDPEALSGLVVPHGHWPHDVSFDDGAKRFVRVLYMAGRPIAAFSEGVRMLLAAGICTGCTLTSPESIRDLVEQAGANWIDSPVATHGHLLSAQGPESMPELMEVFLAAVETFQRLPPTEYLLEKSPPD